MNAPTNGTSVPVARAAEHFASASGSSILSLDPKKCHPAPGNRTPTMELVAPRLLPSIADIGQQVPGIVRDHLAKPGDFEVLAGNLRCFCCGILNIPFKAQKISGDISEAAVIKVRLTENEIYESMSLFDRADDLLRFQQLEGCTQAQLAEKLHLSEALISQTLRTSKNMAPDLRPLVDNFTIRPSVAFLIASLPSHDLQRQVAEKVIQGDLKRDAVAALVARLKGKKPKKPRPAKGKTVGGLSWSFVGTPEAMLAEAERLSKALKTLIGNKWDLSLLASVLKG
jgi:ParB/RepB/Spo0J family partition protein